MRSAILSLPLLLAAAAPTLAQTAPDSPPTLADRIAHLQNLPGFLPLHWDKTSGKLFLEVPNPGAELLYTDSLPYGTGSNDLGLDRGQTAPARLVRFDRQGPKLLLVQENTSFRTSSTDPAEQLATRQSFPESVLWGFKIEAESPSGAVLVDATDFFLHDIHGVAEALGTAHQGAFHLDSSRSGIALDSTRAFPQNTEVEVTLTFTSDIPSDARFVQDVTPDPHALTVRERHSFLALPAPGFQPRRFDPRSGFFDLTFRDTTAPLGTDTDQRLIERHRLVKKDPSCRQNCDPVQPIVYYVDRGAPEPIRSALVEGASWWNQAFTTAGWHNAFQVQLLPEGADPMDVRYNIIQWVHRYTRGWSYGATVTDPRTGEILKGNVTLGSLRARQDYLIAEALLAPYTTGKPLDPSHDPMLTMVLARIRQLAAHETGHTLGLAHNFAASSFAQGASVMDYPHPYITLKNGVPDLSHAYASNIGAWDKVSIDFGYRAFPDPASEAAGLDHILATAEQQGLPYITDEDARPLGSAHPHAHLWDNGPDPVADLDQILAVRAAALYRFGPAAIHNGTPMAQLEETLVPLFLLHRYQTEAAAKEIAGLSYEYNLRGDEQPDPAIVPPAQQQAALTAVLRTLSPAVLTLPEPLLSLLPPHPPAYPRTRESFPSETGLTFDPVAAAESSADLTLSLLCDPSRTSRLVQYHARNPAAPGLPTVLDGISIAVAARDTAGSPLSLTIARAVEARAVEAMLALASNPSASAEARALTRAHLVALRSQWQSAVVTDPTEAAHRAALVARILLFENDPVRFTPSKPIEPPPGMPIGDPDSF